MASNSLKTFVTNIADRIRSIRGYPNTKKIKPNAFPGELDEIIESSKQFFYRNYINNNPLIEVIVPEYIEIIGDSVLRSSKLLEKVEILGEVTEIRGAAFEHCEKLKTIITPYSKEENVCALPDTVKDIGGYAFNKARSMKHFIAPSDLANIGEYAFANCSNCKIFDFSRCKQVPDLLDVTAFSGIASDAKIIVPTALYDSWISTKQWRAIYERIEPAEGYPKGVYKLRVGQDIEESGFKYEDTLETGKVQNYTIMDDYTIKFAKWAIPHALCYDSTNDSFKEYIVDWQKENTMESTGGGLYPYSSAQTRGVFNHAYGFNLSAAVSAYNNCTYIHIVNDFGGNPSFQHPGVYKFWCEDPDTNMVIGHKWIFVVTP